MKPDPGAHEVADAAELAEIAVVNRPGPTWAVVVNWNGGEQNLECLASLLEQGLPEERIVFVDNASGDGSREAVATRFPELVRVDNQRNLGYGDGCNLGIRRALEAGAGRVLLVNNDVVFEGLQLARLESALDEHPEVGIVGPRVLERDRPDHVWCAGASLTWRQNLTTLEGHGRPDGPRWRVTRLVDYVPGCAMLVRAEVFESVGLLNGLYFAYHEDLEFCLLARQAGHGVLLVGEASALHRASSATGGGYNARRKYMMGVNTVWFLRAHGTPWRWSRCFVFDVLSLPAVLLVESLRGRGKPVLAKGLGMWHGLRGRRVTAEVLEPGAGPFW